MGPMRFRDPAPLTRTAGKACGRLGKTTRSAGRALAALRERLAPSVQSQTIVRAARQVNAGAGLLALSVLLDSTMEHYRGEFHNKAMFVPLLVSGLTLAASGHGAGDGVPRDRHHARRVIYAAAAATGVIGLGFHVYNVAKRPGAVSWSNLFYAAPVGAPAALSLAGLLGVAAEHMRGAPRPGKWRRLLGLPFGRALAGLAAVGIAGTSAEAGLMHFRGAFQNPAMFAPVSIPPIAAALLAKQALSRGPHRSLLTRWALRLTALLGFIGTGFHAHGVARSMGGWRNWRQNLFAGPPLPAPPAFTALALVGLAALTLMEDRRG